MRRNWKRILSLLLTVAMIFTMNTSVFATEPGTIPEGDQATVEAAETTESTAAETVEETKETNSEAASETTEESKTEETAPAEKVVAETAPAATTEAAVEETAAAEETTTTEAVVEETDEVAPVEETVVEETEAVVEETAEVEEAKETVKEVKGTKVDVYNLWSFKINDDVITDDDNDVFEVIPIEGGGATVSFNDKDDDVNIVITSFTRIISQL